LKTPDMKKIEKIGEPTSSNHTLKKENKKPNLIMIIFKWRKFYFPSILWSFKLYCYNFFFL